ncbi:MAG TPA: DUF3011 domain-containing protein [Candidatus Polarisedimenticolaceae bacterium]|nr:DUF3011 domain-containing protein [Candidatus Polarisedimenticolaceae bacterium]
MRGAPTALVVVLSAAMAAGHVAAQESQLPRLTITCESEANSRRTCPADTSQGVVLVRSTGSAACLLGKTWGYDDKSIWVSDGCAGAFLVGSQIPEGVTSLQKKAPAYIPNAGFLLVEGDKGQIYMRLFSYVRYLNQKGLDATYTNFFGTTSEIKQREDVQLTKFFLPFSGWFLTPKMRYYLYVWSSNASQGDPAQVVGAGNLSWVFNRFVSLGGGITSLPSVRSTEGQFPYWLGVDDRLIADEFFRGSYTSGLWVKGEIFTKARYMAMLGNNLSTLGVSASQLDTTLNTQSYMLSWLPTTGEFGLYGTFGDFDWHEKLASRVAVHYTHSREDKQSQPGSNSIENSQIRLTDGSVIFTPDLFGPGITVNRVTYDMASLDAGVKWHGMSFEAEYYWRWLSNFAGPGADTIDDIDDHGFQVQVSGMAVKDVLQVYAGHSQILGDYGDGSEIRLGANWYVMKQRGLRLNTEYLHLEDCPVGYTAVPYPVGGNGDVWHVNFEMNF